MLGNIVALCDTLPDKKISKEISSDTTMEKIMKTLTNAQWESPRVDLGFLKSIYHNKLKWFSSH